MIIMGKVRLPISNRGWARNAAEVATALRTGRVNRTLKPPLGVTDKEYRIALEKLSKYLEERRGASKRIIKNNLKELGIRFLKEAKNPWNYFNPMKWLIIWPVTGSFAIIGLVAKTWVDLLAAHRSTKAIKRSSITNLASVLAEEMKVDAAYKKSIQDLAKSGRKWMSVDKNGVVFLTRIKMKNSVDIEDALRMSERKYFEADIGGGKKMVNVVSGSLLEYDPASQLLRTIKAKDILQREIKEPHGASDMRIINLKLRGGGTISLKMKMDEAEAIFEQLTGAKQ